jgi:hypothetical protein
MTPPLGQVPYLGADVECTTDARRVAAHCLLEGMTPLAGLGIGRVRLPVIWTCPSPLCPGAVVVAGIAAVRLACDTQTAWTSRPGTVKEYCEI